MFEPKPLVCQNCGGQIDRATRKCPYCGTQYELPDGIKIVVDRPGVHRIRCETRITTEMMRHSPEAARGRVLQEMRKQIADSLLAYMTFITEGDPMSMCQIIRGEVQVLEPRGYERWIT